MARRVPTEREEEAMNHQVTRVIAGLAAEQVVDGRGDEMTGLMLESFPGIPGERRRGVNREAPAINVLRYVLAMYEESHAV